MNAPTMRGIVREFDVIKGRGTIETEQGARYPVRYSAIQGQGVRKLKTGDIVHFEVVESLNGATAVRVQPRHH